MLLRERLAQALANAKAALDAGDLEKGRGFRLEAEGLQAALAELDAVEAMSKGLAQPQRPGMPASGSGATLPAGEAEPDPAVKAFYQLRFGAADAEVEQVMTELYGKAHRDELYQKSRAFGVYLRTHPQRALPDWVERAGRKLVLTPQDVKAALEQGATVASLKATMVEGTDTLGGYIVPTDWQNRVIERLSGMAAMRGRANVMPTSRDKVEMPVATGGDGQYTSAVRVTWVDETPVAGAAATNLTFGQESVDVHTVMAETALSRNLVEDAAFNIEAYLAQKFAEAAAIDENMRFLVGDGVKKPQGVLPGGLNALGLTEVVTGDADELTMDGLIALTFGIDAQYRQNAVFIAPRAALLAISQMKGSDGQYLWRELYGDNARMGGAGSGLSLLRYPVIEQEGLPAVGAGAFPIIFGDPRGYTIADRVGMSVERYLDSATARTNTVIYVMRRRLGGKVLEGWRFAVQKVGAA